MNYINKAIFEDLQSRYKKVSINKKELAHEMGVSISAINNCIVQGYGVPEYKKLGNAKNARVIFPIICVAEYLSQTIKVA